MVLAHRIRLVPTNAQEKYFVRACGVARFAYNWGLAEWERQRKMGVKPSQLSLRRQLNAIKGERFPWMFDVTKNAPQQAIKNLGTAYKNFFEDIAKYRSGNIAKNRVRVPRLKRKGRDDSFRADPGTERARQSAVRTNGKRVKLPIIGWIRMREEVRFKGKILSVTVHRRADAWYASFQVELDRPRVSQLTDAVVGVDLGITALATLNDSTKVAPPRPLRRYLNKLKRVCRSLTRKQLGSRNRGKAKAKLARLHRRIADIRVDSLHKLTTQLTRFTTVVIDDLKVAEIRTDRRLARAVSDVGLFEFRRQLEYKASMSGSRVIIADKWFPSSKRCSLCGVKNESLSFAARTWRCRRCGTSHDRDINAARNLAWYAESSPASACGAEGNGAGMSRTPTRGVEAGTV